MELDFNRIRFCGRQKELKQLQIALDNVVRRGGGGCCCCASKSKSSPNHNHSVGCSNTSSDDTTMGTTSKNKTTTTTTNNRLVWIQGAGGTGKTALVERFLELQMEAADNGKQQAQQAQQLIVGRGKFEKDGTIPFAAIGECLSSLLDAFITVKAGNSNNSQEEEEEEEEGGLMSTGERKSSSSSSSPNNDNDEDDALLVDPDANTQLLQLLRQDIQPLSSIAPKIQQIFSDCIIDTDTDNNDNDSTNKNNKSRSSSSSSTKTPVSNNWSFERIRVAIRSLIRYICTSSQQQKQKQHCCIVLLILDDLQWADEDSLKLIQTLLQDQHTQQQQFLCIGTSRINNMSNNHNSLISKKKNNSSKNDPRTICTIQLDDLNLVEIQYLIGTLLHRDVDTVQDLADIVYQKTNGVLFFVVQYIRLLYDRKFIVYSVCTYQWEYSCELIISHTDSADNVVQLVCDKIISLPYQLQILLTTATFLGVYEFQNDLLFHILQRSPIVPSSSCSVVSKSSSSSSSSKQDENNDIKTSNAITDKEELDKLLEMAVTLGLLDKIKRGKEANDQKCYKFSHDRVGEAVWALVPSGDDEQRRLHVQLGQTLHQIRSQQLLQTSSTTTTTTDQEEVVVVEENEEESTKLLVLAVRHLNQGGISLLSDHHPKGTILQLAQDNYKVAQFALKKSAFPTAVEFLTTGLRLLDEQTRWEEHYELTLQLSSSLAHARFCCVQHDDNWATMDDVLQHAKTTSDKLNVYRTLILSLHNVGRFDEAIQRNLTILRELGFPFPRHLLLVHLVPLVVRNFWKLQTYTVESFKDFTNPSNEEFRQKQIFLGLFIQSSFEGCFVAYRALGIGNGLRLAFETRRTDMAKLGMIACAMMNGVLGYRVKAYELGQAAFCIAKEGKDPSHDARVMAVTPHLFLHWKMPYHTCLESLLVAYQLFLDSGQIELLHAAIVPYTTMYFHCGLRLAPLKKDILRFVEILEDFGQINSLTQYNPTVHLVTQLMNSEDTPKSTVFDKNMPIIFKEYLQIPKEQNEGAKQYHYRQQMILAYYLDEMKYAEEMSSMLSPPRVEGPVSWLPPRFYFQGLVSFALCRSTGKVRYLRRGRWYLQRLKKFVKEGNVNCLHMAMLLAAEDVSLSRRRKTASEVRLAYDKAITASGRLGFLNDQALGNELAGAYCICQDDKDWASTYLSRSYDLFRQWGATAKVRQMDRKYKHLLEKTAEYSSKSGRSSTLLARSRIAETVPAPDKSDLFLFGKSKHSNAGQ